MYCSPSPALVYLAVRLREGRNWAGIALVVLYGGFGALSLVIGPITCLAEGGSLADAMAAADLESGMFAASRLVHVAAIIATLILMSHPAANAYLRATRRIRAEEDRNEMPRNLATQQHRVEAR
jgi:hypothetical protein